jgi:hypothetical protein
LLALLVYCPVSIVLIVSTSISIVSYFGLQS